MANVFPVPQSIGTDRDYQVGPLVDSGNHVPTFTGSEALPWTIWRADGGPAEASGNATWISAPAGTIKLTVPASATTNLTPGRYRIALRIVSGSQTIDALSPDTFIDFADAVGAAAPSPGRLVSLEEAQASLDAATGARADLGFLLDAASRAVEKFIGFAVTLGTYTEISRPENTRILRLSKAAPVNSISSMAYGKAGSTTPITDYTIVGDGWTGEVEIYTSQVAGFRYPDRLYGGDPRYGNVTTQYSGGLATPAIPADLKDAVIQAVKARADRRKAGAFRSESLGAYSYSIASPGAGLPDDVKETLMPWRRKRFV